MAVEDRGGNQFPLTRVHDELDIVMMPKCVGNIVARALGADCLHFSSKSGFPVGVPVDRLVMDMRPPRLRGGVLMPATVERLGYTDVKQHVVGIEEPVEGCLLTHLPVPRFGSGRVGNSSMSPTYQRANRRMITDRLASGSARLAASSSRCQRSSSMRIRRNGVPSGAILSAFLSVTAHPLMWVVCSYSMPYTVAMSNATETPAEQPRCLRCGRKLTASTGYGPKCAAKIRKAALDAARADFTAEQQAKADELIRDGALVPAAHKGVFRAVSSRGDAVYLVHAAACNCPGGLRSKRPCYHQLAARVLGISSRRSMAKAA
jgi:hypothetical protein